MKPIKIDEVTQTPEWRMVMGGLDPHRARAYADYLRTRPAAVIGVKPTNISPAKGISLDTPVKKRKTVRRKGTQHERHTRATTITLTDRHLKFCPSCGTSLTGIEAFLEARAQARSV